MLKAGIIGLPNAGKSTIFNALLGSHKAQVESYPFSTIEPNIGVVNVPDPRLEKLATVVKVQRIVHGMIEFVDIAGLIEGASKGEGLGNRFLAHIREVDALVHVVRCFEDPDVPHLPGHIDPIRDVHIIQSELILADIESVERQMEKARREARRGTHEAIRALQLLEQVHQTLNNGRPASTLHFHGEDATIARNFFLLSSKPQIFVANVGERDLPNVEKHPHIQALRSYAATLNYPCIVICGSLEEQLIDLEPEDRLQYLQTYGLKEPGISTLIRATSDLLGLISFFTFNEQELRAWLIPKGTRVVEAAGKIHTDMERGFIKAELVRWEDLLKAGSVAAAREQGHYRVEGRDYIVQDGDIILIRFKS